MSYEDYNENECGGCKYYTPETSKRGSCSKYNSSEWADEKGCDGRKYEPVDGYSSGCFFTSLMCDYLNKKDDCEELTLLRQIRDNVLMKTEEGRSIIEGYYKLAPSIVKRIKKSSNKEEVYSYLYKNTINIIDLYKGNRICEAICCYKKMLSKML